MIFSSRPLSSLLPAALLMAAATAAQAAPAPGQGTWQSTLQARDINNDGTVDAFYDTVLNLTWLADGNAGYTDDTGGLMTWADAKAWAASLDVFGVTGWRLPMMIDTGAMGCDFSYAGGTDCGYNVQTISADGLTIYSEWAHLFYETLGNLAYCAPGFVNCSVEPAGWGLTNTGDFRNLQASDYWSGLAYSGSEAWYFFTYYGYQNVVDFPGQALYALAVRPGDVTASVPEPQTLGLVLAALGAAAVVRRRQSR